jgi:hypothetical protein
VQLDDPQNILKRDAIESLLKTKAVEYCVAAKEDILLYIDHFFDAMTSLKDTLDEAIFRAVKNKKKST